MSYSIEICKCGTIVYVPLGMKFDLCGMCSSPMLLIRQIEKKLAKKDKLTDTPKRGE